MKKKHRLFLIAAIWLLLVVLFPPLNYIFPFGYAIKYAIFMAVALLLFPKLLFKRSMVILIVYTVETFFYYLIGNDFFKSVNDVVTPFFAIGATLILIEYTLNYDLHYKFTKKTLLISIVALIGISLISIPILLINPMIIRLAYSVSSKGDQDVAALSSFLISWETINGLVYIMAPMVFMCKKALRWDKYRFFFWLFALLLFYFVLLISNVATPFVISTLLILISFFFSYERFSQKVFVKMGALSIVMMFLMNPSVMVPTISFFQEHMERGSTYTRLEEIKYTIINGKASGNDMEKRNEHYEQSWNLFLESPLIGTTTPKKIGHHSYLLDRLACHGIFLIIPFVLLFYEQYKKVYKTLIHTRVIYIWGVLSMVFLLIYKGESDTNYLCGFFLLPAMCRYIDSFVESNIKIRKTKKI